MRGLRFGLVLGVLLGATACGSDQSASTTTLAATTSVASTTVPATTVPTTTVVPTTPVPSTVAPTTAAVPTTTLAPTTTAAATTTVAPTTTTAAPQLVDVRIYLLRGERLVIAHRRVEGPAVLGGALDALLAGPTSAERAAGLGTTIPDGTTLRGVNLENGLATVDLGDAFDDGGGTLSMTARVAQVIFTATQFDNVERVQFWINGSPIDALGGEGLILSDPQQRMNVSYELSGNVIVDTPAYGATVGNPFTVTGEGDVYEGQFPIEVWANGEQVAFLAPVTAGAWGDWRDFEATITLDASVPAGPITLVTYDEGGCGTDPECPPIIRTEVPLTYAP